MDTTRDIRAAVRSAHVKQTTRTRQRLRAAYASVLRSQIRAVADHVAKTGVVGIASAWHDASELERLVSGMRVPMFLTLLDGARAELHWLKQSKTTAEDIARRLDIDIPPGVAIHQYPDWLLDRIAATLTETFQQPFWERVNQTTRDQIERVMDEGLLEGYSVRRIARNVEALGGAYTRYRAVKVARTESSRALNSGHATAIEGIRDETGLPIGKEWVSVLGTTTRETHAAADGQQVQAGEYFTVGGYDCRFPSDYMLPPHEAINCQCTVISTLAGI